jgi:hypothetical protein
MYKLCFTLFLLFSITSHAEDNISITAGRIHHVVIVWLNKAGDITARKKYLDTSIRLAKLPGVSSYNIGTVLANNKGEVVDSSYDIAVVSTFENQQALSAYVQHPEHKKIIDGELKPLVKKCIVYDFSE